MATAMQGMGVWSAPAGEDLSGALFTFVTLHSDGLVYQANSGDAVAGVLVEGDTAGNYVTFQYSDVVKVTLGATLTPGTRVMSDNSGNAVAAIDSPVNGGYEAGMLLSGGNSGEIATLLLNVAAV